MPPLDFADLSRFVSQFDTSQRESPLDRTLAQISRDRQQDKAIAAQKSARAEANKPGLGSVVEPLLGFFQQKGVNQRADAKEQGVIEREDARATALNDYRNAQLKGRQQTYDQRLREAEDAEIRRDDELRIKDNQEKKLTPDMQELRDKLDGQRNAIQIAMVDDEIPNTPQQQEHIDVLSGKIDAIDETARWQKRQPDSVFSMFPGATSGDQNSALFEFGGKYEPVLLYRDPSTNRINDRVLTPVDKEAGATGNTSKEVAAVRKTVRDREFAAQQAVWKGGDQSIPFVFVEKPGKEDIAVQVELFRIKETEAMFAGPDAPGYVPPSTRPVTPINAHSDPAFQPGTLTPAPQVQAAAIASADIKDLSPKKQAEFRELLKAQKVAKEAGETEVAAQIGVAMVELLDGLSQ